MRCRLGFAASALAILLALAGSGCESKEEAEAEQKSEAIKTYVNTSVDWVNKKLAAGGAKLGAPKENLLNVIKEENYRVCKASDNAVHAFVPNSKIHPGEQDIHIVAVFDAEGKIRNLQLSVEGVSGADLSADCR